jgi:GTP-binding protein
MKKLLFSKAYFVTSSSSEETLPLLRSKAGAVLDEIAIVGRSNVGKSSLINHLFHSNKLAKTSSTPGKTQLVNFFNVDDTIALVDLPGYGYAKAPGKVRKEWGQLLTLYLEKREALVLTLFLLDIRREPSEEDIAFVRWAVFHRKALLPVFTKADKVKANEVAPLIRAALKKLEIEDLSYALYSVKEGRSRPELIDHINKHLLGATT